MKGALSCYPALTMYSAVTGNSAGLPLAVRQADCSAFLSPSPTPTVPSYASACNPSKYSSACACLDYAAPTDTCITPAKATWIVDTFASLLTAPQAPDFSSKANALLASTFTDTSGSINFLANKNVRAGLLNFSRWSANWFYRSALSRFPTRKPLSLDKAPSLPSRS